MHDVMVIGAGPAGAAAAILLAERGHKVLLVDRNAFPMKAGYVGWLNVRAAPLLAQLGIPVKPLLNEAFSDVTFHSADFNKSAKPSFAGAAGYLIDRALFANAMVAAAEKGGVELAHGVAVKNVSAAEDRVSATLEDGRVVAGRLLVFAAGRGSGLVERLGLTRASRYGSMWSATVDVPLKKKQRSPRVDVVLGVDKKGSFGLSCVSKARMCVSINWMGEREGTITRCCRSTCRRKRRGPR
jgi:2-polyprenyl-6-methoxyphenol hydroxylase-like FAD-dependent oxidoreductase